MQDMYNNLTGAEWAQLGNTTLGLGLGYFGKEKDLASAQAQADALKAKGLSDVEVARIMLESKTAKRFRYYQFSKWHTGYSKNLKDALY